MSGVNCHEELRLDSAPGLRARRSGHGVRFLGSTPLSAAEQAYRRGDYVSAAELYGQAVGEADDPGHAVFNRAAALYLADQFNPASKDFRSAQDSGVPDRCARSLYNLGNCALRRACEPQQTRVTPLLQEAIGNYESCLTQEQAADASLLDNARHNQALAKRLLALQPDAPKPPPDERREQSTAKDVAPGDPQKPASSSEASAMVTDQKEVALADPKTDTEGTVDPLFKDDKSEAEAAQPNDQAGDPQSPQGPAEKSGDKAKDTKTSDTSVKPSKGKAPGKDQQVAQAEDNSRKNNTDKESKKEPEQQCPT